MAVWTDRLHARLPVGANADFYTQLGRRIAAFRRAVGLSQEKLGERARVASSYVAHIEIGSRRPTIDVLLRIADAVNAPLWRLLTDDRFTADEKAWDAASRELATNVRGLPQSDVQILSYLATRLRTAEGPTRPKALATLAAEPRAPRLPSSAKPKKPR
jgi:transcriptional regulator with XRE-family HTH domain